MNQYMTQKELAQFLDVGQTTISYWHKHKMIPDAKRINNRPKYTMEDAKEIASIRGIKSYDGEKMVTPTGSIT